MRNSTPSSARRRPNFYLFRNADGHYSAVATHLLESMRINDALGVPVLDMQPLTEAMALAFIRKRDGTVIR